MRLSLLACLAVVCFAGRPTAAVAQPAAARDVASLAPGDIALELRRARRGAGVDYGEQLRLAEVEFAAGKYAAVDARLMSLAAKSFLDSRAIELAYRSRLAMGQDAAAAKTLAEGLAIYPHAVRLLRLAPTRALLDDTLALAAVNTDRRYPEALRYELRAGLAFRQNAFATGLLEAERASYLYGGGDELGVETKQAVAEAYARLLTSETEVAGEAPDTIGTFDETYARAFRLAAAKMRAGGLDTLSNLMAVAKLRAVALRLFVREGGLARWADPMLVDLYVLDRAGHLETATALQLGWMFPQELLAFEQTRPGEVLRCRTYINEEWRAAADKYVR